MRFFKIIIILFFFISCDETLQDVKQESVINTIKIPNIIKNKTDSLFKLKNGVLFYNDMPYSGIVKEFYNDEKSKSTSEYYQGKREGKYFGFYPNQQKWFERFYAKGLKVKIHKGWFLNGQQMFEYQFNKKGVYNGFVKDWHNNGQLAKYFNFVDGKENGSQKMWKPTGKIRANFYTVNGERHGLIGLKNCVSVINKEQN
ncbi:toxin-antitoxin system YwqK family antitoxin [Polaribacter porphyrae]|uniref:toxin-antitoxin system YwqK family antitoxin n=1 Tax=Polaribacter porphyrae TaxID=1137780 RepID=UPI000CF40E96|nr:hypothetical protein [Polaribacter porphyrae]